MTLPRNVLVALVFSTFAGALGGQESACAVADAQCWQRAFEDVCRVKGATQESCSAWLQSLERSSRSAEVDVRLAQASAHLALADLVGEGPARAQHRRQAEEIYRSVARDDGTNTRALLGLALFADGDERLNLLREASASDPTDDALLELLADNLWRADPLAGAEVLEQAYSAVSPSRRKWHLAGAAMALYEYGGAMNRAIDLRSRVRDDYNLDRHLLEVAGVETTSAERVGTVLDEICSSEMVSVFGAQPCLESIVKTLGATKSNPDLAEGVSRGIMAAAQSAPRLDQADSDWRSKIGGALEGLMESGTMPARVYMAYALTTPSRDKRFAVMDAAAKRFPSDGEVVFGLGLAALDQRRKNDAVQAFTRAKALLPVERHAHIDRMLEQASALPD